MTDRAWWQSRWYAIGLACLMAVPLLWPDIPPITDLLGHIGRYGVELERAGSPFLQRYYGFEWGLIGNMGIDLLVVPLSRLMGLEPAVKLIVLLIPPLTAGGLLWMAKEAHGRIPPSAAFALPFAYGYPFQFGFANFALSMALAFLAFGYWLQLGRTGRMRLRAMLFVPIGLVIWVCHSYGWAVLCLLAAAAELIRMRDGTTDDEPKRSLPSTVWHAGLACLPLVPPMILMLVWRSGAVAGTTGGYTLIWKYAWLLAALRDDARTFDQACVALVFVLLGLGVARIGFRYNRTLGLAALFLFAAYALLPRVLLGSAYADMRMAPYALAVAVVALRPIGNARWWRPALAVAALAFLVVRLTGHTLHYARLDRAYDEQLAAVEHLPIGARVMVLVNLPCQGSWSYSRMDHLGSLAIGRRQAFVNGQWAMAGAQLLTIRNPHVGRFGGDPTQLLRPLKCRRRGEPVLADTLRNFPRAAYDHFWLIDMPRSGWLRYPDLVPVWHGRTRGILYRVVPAPVPAKPQAGSATSASDTPNGNDPRATM
ncbi:hypothetical protein ACFSGX_01005 [Sphingomonas arantia]|uniref:Glycosyltransferase RgtA/B/C/D-like domain-containing protein n=1 Tax=Sphingomonas arantia TaxID=1460676 RepID=A0ABW4TUU4_9SPHN